MSGCNDLNLEHSANGSSELLLPFFFPLLLLLILLLLSSSLFPITKERKEREREREREEETENERRGEMGDGAAAVVPPSRGGGDFEQAEVEERHIIAHRRCVAVVDTSAKCTPLRLPL